MKLDLRAVLRPLVASVALAPIAALAFGAPASANTTSAPANATATRAAAATCTANKIVGVADWDRDGHKDIVTIRNATGDLWLYPGQSRRTMSTENPVKIGNGWSAANPAGLADWDRDGHQDIVTIDSNGDMWLYPGQSVRGYSQVWRVKIGNGWNNTRLAGIGDWDKDGHQDILAIDWNQDLWLYPGESKRGYSRQSRVKIGNGWGGATPAGVSDWDKDGHQDLLTTDWNGDLWLYPGQSVRGYSQAGRVKIGNGWNGSDIGGLGDWDRDGHQDLVTTDWNGDLWLYPGESKRGYSQQSRAKIGNGWC